MTSRRIDICVCILLVIGFSAFDLFGAQRGRLQVGAARVDITPAPDAALPMSGYSGRTQGFQRIHDHIYVRAVVLTDGTNSAALLVWELIGVPTRVWEDLSQRIAKEAGIPTQNLLLAAVHNHGAPALAGMYGREATNPLPQTLAYTAKAEDDAIEALRRAKSNLQPAQVGFGTGKAYVNINRREFFRKKGWWWLGYNPEGASDKSVAILKFTALSGKPIALFINYPVHAVVMGTENLAVTGDLAGATARYVEQFYQGKIQTRGDSGGDLELRPEEKVSDEGPVAVWTSGAAGDQNPIVMDRGEDFSMVDALGRILGEESVRVANLITVMSSQARISSSHRLITCPGRRVQPGELPRAEYKFEDSDPVNIRLSLLRLNDVVLAGVSGEVFTNIYQSLKKRSPLNTIMVTHANGSSGYIPSDDAFDEISYEITTTHLKPGCAESGIVNSFLEMMESE
jgi:neutral/alkaline ceramidase-like enzyme